MTAVPRSAGRRGMHRRRMFAQLPLPFCVFRADRRTAVPWRCAAAAVLCLAVCSLHAVTAGAADLSRAKQLIQIGDYAQAVTELHEFATKNPADLDVHLLLARAFAECEFHLKMPGEADGVRVRPSRIRRRPPLRIPGRIGVGWSNQTRACHELGLRAKAGAAGQKRLFAAIGAGGKLAPLAVRSAATAKLEAAVPAIAKALERKDADAELVRAAESALAQIGGPKAAEVLRKRIDRETNPNQKRQLISGYLRCLDDAALGQLARTSKDELLLSRLAGLWKGASPATLIALAGRTDLPDKPRTAALDRLKSLAKPDNPEYRMLLAAQRAALDGLLRVAKPDNAELRKLLAEQKAALDQLRRAGRPDSPKYRELLAARRAALDGLLRAAKPDNPEYRKLLVEQKAALDQLERAAKPDTLEYCRLLATLVNDKSPRVSWAAVEQLVDADPDKAAGPLIAELKNKDHATSAARLLRKVKSKASLDGLLNVLEELSDRKKHKNWAVKRDDVFDALVAAGARGKTLIDGVRLMLKPDPVRNVNPDPRFAKVLERQRFENAGLPRLPIDLRAAVAKELVNDKDPMARCAAVQSLTYLDPDTALAVAKAALDDKNAYIRNSAARVALDIINKKPDDVKAVIPLIGFDDNFVRNYAIRLVTKQREKAALKPMLELINDDARAKHSRDEISEFFVVVPDKAAVKPLIARLRHSHTTDSVDRLTMAIKRCAEDETATAVNEIAKLLKSKPDNVRCNAATALRVLGHEGVRGPDSVLKALARAERAAKSPRERQTIQQAIKALTAEE